MKTTLVINNRFPGLNDYTKKNRGNKFSGASLKKQYTQLVMYEAINQKIKRMSKPVVIKTTWYESGKRDPDNVAFAKKFILDGLVKARVLKDDRWSNVVEFHDYFVKSKSAKVVIEIREV